MSDDSYTFTLRIWPPHPTVTRLLLDRAVILIFCEEVMAWLDRDPGDEDDGGER